MATLKNTTVDDINFVKIAVGTTGERSGTPAVGEIRYNSTTGLYEGYAASGWQVLSPINLKVTGVTPVSGFIDQNSATKVINPAVAAVFDINGFNFAAGSTVRFDSFSVPSGCVTYISPFTIRINTGTSQITAGTYSNITVTDPSGFTTTVAYPIQYTGGPVFSTATSLGTFTESALSMTVAATAPGASSITYSAQTGSGYGATGFGLPTGLSINSSTGAITGTLVIDGTRTFNLTIRATDNLSRIAAKDFTFVLSDNSSPTITGPSAGSLGTLPYPSNVISGSGSTQTTTSSIATFTATDPESNGITFRISSGTLPEGINLSSSGTLSGTVTIGTRTPASQVFNFGVKAVDAFSNESAERAYSLTVTTPFYFRQILTTGYITAGYKSGVPWRSVNRLIMASEVVVDLSDQLPQTYNYKNAAISADKQYAFGVGADTVNTSPGVKTVAYNMRTEVAAMSTSCTFGNRSQCGVLHAIDGFQTAAYVSGGFSGTNADAIEKFSFTTETWNTISGQTTSTTNHVGAWGASTDGYGVWQGGTTLGSNGISYQARWTFATESNSSWSTSLSNSDQQKTLMSKVDKVYGGNGGTYGDDADPFPSSVMRRTIWSTQAQVTFSKNYTYGSPGGRNGEENWVMGMDRGWAIGVYDGAQNNNALRVIYASDVITSTTESTWAKGPAGRSSGCVGWRD